MSSDDLGAPQYHVVVLSKGKQSENVTDRCLRLSHHDKGSRRSSQIEMEFDNGDNWVVAHEDLMRKGAVYQIRYGYPSHMRSAGEFISKEIKGDDDSIVITAHERKRSRMMRKMETVVWSGPGGVRRSNVVRQILSDQGIPNNQIFVDESKDLLPSITQSNESNWQFLQRLADAEGFVLYTDESGVYWIKPRNTEESTHVFKQAKNILGIGLITKYSIDSFGAGIPGRIVFRSRDPLTKQPIEVVADEETTEDFEPMEITLSDFKTPDKGDQEDAGDSGFEIVRNIGARSKAEAKRLADSLYKDYRYGAMKVSITTMGDPTLRTNRTMIVYGVGPTIDGTYMAKEVKHNLDATYTCELQLRRGGPRKKRRSKTEDDKLKKSIDKIEKKAFVLKKNTAYYKFKKTFGI